MRAYQIIAAANVSIQKLDTNQAEYFVTQATLDTIMKPQAPLLLQMEQEYTTQFPFRFSWFHPQAVKTLRLEKFQQQITSETLKHMFKLAQPMLRRSTNFQRAMIQAYLVYFSECVGKYGIPLHDTVTFMSPQELYQYAKTRLNHLGWLGKSMK